MRVHEVTSVRSPLPKHSYWRYGAKAKKNDRFHTHDTYAEYYVSLKLRNDR